MSENHDESSAPDGAGPTLEPASPPASEAGPESQAVPDALQRNHREMVRLVGSLPELTMRRASIGSALCALPVEEAVWSIDQLIRGALWGDEAALEAMLACSYWLIHVRLEDDYELLKSLFEAAYEADRQAVLSLMRDAPPQRSLAAGRSLPEVRLPMERDTTLGERRAMAGGSNRRMLERLLMEPSPLVISRLLDNPHIRLQDVIVIASRRPTTPDLLEEVALNAKWFRRHDVREALALNPFVATGLALKILPTLHVATLRLAANGGDLHPIVSESAKRLVLLREERTAPWRV